MTARCAGHSLTLAENDPVQYDVDFWLDYFKRAKCDAACLSAGGCVAYYPSKIPYHYVTPFMKDRDSFGELYEGCRKLGMVVIARTDPHAIHQDAFEAHPEWVAWMRMEARRNIGPHPTCGLPVRWARTTSSI